MTLRTRHISRFQISIAACVLAAGFLLGACGGGSSDDDDGSATSGGGDVDVEQTGEQEGSPAADTSDDATATVVLDGTTYRFTSNPDATLKTRTYCSDLNGSLQGTLRLVDESGAFVEGGKVDFGLFDPDSDSIPAGVDPGVVVNLPSAPASMVRSATQPQLAISSPRYRAAAQRPPSRPGATQATCPARSKSPADPAHR